jgi:hypothetical protein
MSTLPAHYHGTATGLLTRYAFLRHVNMNTLAFVLFVALALLNSTRAKESPNNDSAHARDTNTELVIRPCDTSVLAQQELHAYTFSAKNSWNKIPRNR